MKKAEVYIEAMVKWGIHLQLELAVEEMAELIQAIIKFQRNPRPTERSRLEDEIADVEIMMEQLRTLFDTKRISRVKGKKIRRLFKRLKEERDE